MAETTKSVLFVDYDSIHRSLADDSPEAAERLAARVAAWVGAVETGRIFVDKPSAATRRRILMRRCYADPELLGNERAAFLSNGFQLVDCPPAEGRERNSAAIQMVLDTLDALEHPAAYEEFVLLSADTDLSPLLIRLRAHNRTTAIYSNPATDESYKAITDAMIDESRLVSILLAEDEPADDAAPQAERSEVEALARKVSAATNVPLFAPKTFAELFRHLVDEIAENGYHFQTTAENVATRMAAAGRNVTRRQVVFVVKGLALKGHVFSTGDTPDRLAEVFREQVLYLAENAGIEIDEKEKSVLSSWIVGRPPPASAGASQETEIQPAGPGADGAAAGIVKTAAKSADGQSSRSSRRKQQRSTVSPKPEAVAPPPRPAPEPPKPAVEAVKPPPPAAKPAEEPKAAPRTILAAKPMPIAAKPGAAPPKPLITPAKPAPDAGSPPPAATARPASPLAGAAARPPLAGATRPPPLSKPAARPTVSDADKEAVESSILAAIAEAVDVLVEDSGPKLKRPARSGETGAAPPEKRPPPSPAADEVPEGDDIGDEIQRIIASYNRNRGQDERR